MIDSILFDLDGTLWNANAAICTAWNQALAQHPDLGIVLTVEQVRGCMGLVPADIAQRLLTGAPAASRDGLMAECVAGQHAYLARHGGTLYPGVPETLAVLAAHYRLFLVSNCPDGYIQAFFAYHRLEPFFAGFECAGRTGLPKAENIKRVVAQYGLKSPIYVGDTLLDCTSAQSAGVPFLHAAYGFGTAPGAPAIPAFAQLPEALHRLTPP